MPIDTRERERVCVRKIERERGGGGYLGWKVDGEKGDNNLGYDRKKDAFFGCHVSNLSSSSANICSLFHTQPHTNPHIHSTTHIPALTFTHSNPLTHTHTHTSPEKTSNGQHSAATACIFRCKKERECV